ncbi:MAG: HlyD family type I secretion periplasmic adaptor subunit [Alphaproteobacteria bacterium]|nr:HlyD family type I secretion periplasmic adaptor subunit [Alphaproteobacteria bacterium]
MNQVVASGAGGALAPSKPGPAPTQPPLAPVPINPRGPVIGGFVVLLLALGGFGIWAALTDLSSAAIAIGNVAVEGNRKTVQHLEGGIIDEILAQEGARVEAGDILIRLDATRARADLGVVESRYIAALVRLARLEAESVAAEQVDLPAQILDLTDRPQVIDLIDRELDLFEARRSALAGQIEILEQRLGQLSEQRQGLLAERAARVEQIRLIQEELVGLRELNEKGFAPKTRVLALERAAAELQGELGSFESQIATIDERRGETRLQVIQLRNDVQEQVATNLREVQDQVFDLEERLVALRDIVRRTEVVAPQTGTVLGLKVFTQGAVIRPGDPLLDIVPDDQPLVIQAQIEPQDADVVFPGLQAEVRFSALNQRTTPIVFGEVKRISADAFTDQNTGRSFYRAKVEVRESEMAKLAEFTLTPGMPAEVIIKTGNRTALDYFVKPLTDRLVRAFREE